MKKKKLMFEKGQIGLIVILIMAVGLTIGLAIASQSVTDISISETEEKSLRAFNAAEAGIEEVLQMGSLGNTSLSFGGITTEVTVNKSKCQEITLEANETIEVDLRGATTNNVRVSWVDTRNEGENPDSCAKGEGLAPASLEIIKIKVIGEAITPYRYLYDSSSCNGLSPGFTTAIEGSEPYLSTVTVPIDSNDTALRIRTFYNQATVAVRDADEGPLVECGGSGEGLPTQTYQIVSKAETDTGETRTIEVSKTVETWPPIFDYVLFSGGQLAQ